MAEDSHKESAAGGKAAGEVRTAGETPAAGRRRPDQRPVRPRSAARRPVRPRPRSSGSGVGARVLAPLALVICVFAVFSVLTSDGNDVTSPGSAEKSARQSKKGGSAGGKSSASQSGAAAKPVRATYRVKAGDTFSAIAVKTGVDVDKLAQLNPGVDPRALQTGQKLKLK